MTSNIQCPHPPERMYQECPLCGERQPIMMKGLVCDLDTGTLKAAFDKGYSFCNCNDIFFTSRKNLDPTIYDNWYHKKYQNEDIKTIADFEIERIYKLVKALRPEAKTVFEIGAVHDHWMDFLKEKGFEVAGLDVIDHGSKHKLIVSDFEGKFSPEKTYDVVLASHVFEHFTNPHMALEKLEMMLNKNGIVYIAMPDHFLLEWNDALNWDWNVQEHFILWNMESFIEFCEKRGWTCIYKKRPLDLHTQKKTDLFWKREFQIILCRQ